MYRRYIKLWRKIEDWVYFTEHKMFVLWITLLINATHKPQRKVFNGDPITVKPGQFITGRKYLSKKTGVPESTVERLLTKLENEHQIEQQKCTQSRLITITNWEDYQNSKQQMDNDWTTNGQRVDTNKNGKHNKHGKNDKVYSQNSDEFRLSKLLFDLIRTRKPNYKNKIKTEKQIVSLMQEWSVHIDRQIRIDGRTPEQIEKVIHWCQEDDFWQNNILSTQKLREQIDNLELRIEKEEEFI